MNFNFIKLDYKKVLCLLRAFGYRLVFLFAIGFLTHYLVGYTNNYVYLSMVVSLLVILIEGFVVVVFRSGLDYTWYSFFFKLLCFFKSLFVLNKAVYFNFGLFNNHDGRDRHAKIICF